MKIIISPYQAQWPEIFQEEKTHLERFLPAASLIEHIGSTSVTGLAAKPVIDILIGLADFNTADSFVPQIESLHYKYMPQYEDTMPYRRFFRKENQGIRTHHIHMVAIGGEFWQRHLAFRDYLRRHPDTAAEYAALKLRLADREWNDMNDYADAKTDFIQGIEAFAL